MSGSEAEFSGSTEPGAYAWPGDRTSEETAELVTKAGRRFVHLAGDGLTTKQAVLVALGETLEFPAYYGANLDALEECLADLAEPPVLLWTGWPALAAEDDRTFRTLLEIFTDQGLIVLLPAPTPA